MIADMFKDPGVLTFAVGVAMVCVAQYAIMAAGITTASIALIAVGVLLAFGGYRMISGQTSGDTRDPQRGPGADDRVRRFRR